MYQLHHFYNYHDEYNNLQRRQRAIFNLRSLKKKFLATKNVNELFMRGEFLAYLVKVNKTKALYTLKSHVAKIRYLYHFKINNLALLVYLVRRNFLIEGIFDVNSGCFFSLGKKSCFCQRSGRSDQYREDQGGYSGNKTHRAIVFSPNKIRQSGILFEVEKGGKITCSLAEGPGRSRPTLAGFWNIYTQTLLVTFNTKTTRNSWIC